MKNIFLIGGTMGVGKTTTCKILKKKLNNSVFLDGDWCWDMHEQSIIDDIISRLNTSGCKVYTISLVCSEQALCEHLRKDVAACIRTEDMISRSIERLPLYDKLNTYKVNVSNISPEQVADFIIENFEIS